MRLRQLFQMVAHEVQPHIIYSELLKALDHPMVRPVIDRVSQRRLDYLVASFRQAGLSSTDARHRARLAYAAYVGFLQLSLQLQQQAGPRGFRGLCRASDRDAHSQLNGRMAPCKCRMRLAGDLNAPTYVVVRLVSRDLGIFLTTL